MYAQFLNACRPAHAPDGEQQRKSRQQDQCNVNVITSAHDHKIKPVNDESKAAKLLVSLDDFIAFGEDV